jgi:TonB family protein
MKTIHLLLFVLFTVLFCHGCSEKKNDAGFEVINDTGGNYYTLSEIETAPETRARPQVNEDMLAKSLSDKKLFNKAGAGETLYLYELYLNEKGAADKLRIIEGMGNDLDSIVVSQMKLWKYRPAKKDGKNVKSRFLVYWNFKFEQNGEYMVSAYDNIKTRINPMISEKILSNSKDYLIAVEDMPAPIGGIKAIQSRIQYTEIAKRAGIEGKIYVLACINEEGTVDKVQIIRGLGAGLDEAAIDAVKQTKFSPGKQGGKPVKVQVSIPIVFRLN